MLGGITYCNGSEILQVGIHNSSTSTAVNMLQLEETFVIIL